MKGWLVLLLGFVASAYVLRRLLTHQHDWMVTFAPGRVFQECQTCHRQRPGWTLDATPPRVTYSKATACGRRCRPDGSRPAVS